MASSGSMIGLQGKVAILALFPILFWGAYKGLLAHRTETEFEPVRIAVEHAGPAGITISHSIGGSAFLTDIENESEADMHLSVPAEWERGEVRNAPLSSIASDAPDFGFRRWLFPPRAAVSFDAKEEWRDLIVHNPSGVLLKVRVITVNLQTNETNTDTYFVQEEDLRVTF